MALTTPERTSTPTKRLNRNGPASVLVASTLVFASCSSSDSTVVDDKADSSSVESSSDGELAAGATDASAVETAATDENQASHFDADDLDYDESEAVEIVLDGDSASAASDDVDVDGATVTITAEGVYALSGTLDNGQVVVNAGDDDDVTLVLEGVDITNTSGAAIAVMNADEALVVLAEGTTNNLTDGANFVFPDAETDEPNATLYSAADLAIAGEGELVVSANYNDGIASKDGLVIDGGVISVDAVDDGIRGKDYVIVNGGSATIVAGGDAIKSDNEEDAERGYVLVTDGVLDIVAGDDGIQAATDVQIDGGSMTLAVIDDGIHGEYFVTINGGSITITEAFEGIESEILTINDGVIDVTANDDALNVTSANTTTSTAAATAAAPVGRGGGGGGGLEVVGEYYIYINGGTISLTTTDALAEQGDGIDANGHVVMTGGIVTISGATDTRNSALDYSGGSFEMSGGLLIGTNVEGRNSQGVGVGSSQASVYISSSSIISAGTVVHIESTDGESLVTFEPENDYSAIVFSSPDLVAGESYDVYLGGTVSGGSATNLYDDADYTAGERAGTVVAN